jgi:hypothetical protein
MLEPIRLVFVALHIFIVMPLWMSLALRIVDSFLKDQIGDVTSVLKDPATVQKLDLWERPRELDYGLGSEKHA